MCADDPINKSLINNWQRKVRSVYPEEKTLRPYHHPQHPGLPRSLCTQPNQRALDRASWFSFGGPTCKIHTRTHDIFELEEVWASGYSTFPTCSWWSQDWEPSVIFSSAFSPPQHHTHVAFFTAQPDFIHSLFSWICEFYCEGLDSHHYPTVE